jgi:L-ascorbate metabolism protein UlaG (beta-lactamase superfamily)
MIKKMIIALLTILIAIALAIFLYMQQPQFAQPDTTLIETAPTGASIRVDQRFHNQQSTQIIASDSGGMLKTLFEFIVRKDERAVPAMPLPSQKTDLHQLKPTDNVIVWMGHSSYFIQTGGLRLLIDPVFSDNASPVPHTNVPFAGSNIYHAEDIPPIDYLLITHDHWDHLDYPTVKALLPKISQVITPLGVDSYFKQWGFAPDKIFSGDWNSVYRGKGIEIHLVPARHFSGRLFKKDQTLWTAFVVITAGHKFYLGGDSGYGEHFKQAGRQFGPFDAAVLECGQYDPNWKLIHMTPEEAAQAALDLNAQSVLPVHNSKFKLAHHSWDDPLKRIAAASQNQPYRLLTPMIGESIDMNNPNQRFSHWWQQRD